ncbi:PFL family protein [Lactobacillus sp. CC-MHH1034]|uniref:PFL family protein n=1 Tax=Agrilactobacillus fermenti TaxID=2586909 RepID=UPI001E47CB2E|nr:PFL family protein [Agrilactobacillus fermenti]MCD2255717.1 PFL family protein [Agrilactobacillus fermenti]
MEEKQILETIQMVSEENLDIRTITMGISLLDCIDPNAEAAARKIYDKITHYAKNLVPVAKAIEMEYGIPIVNKRISVTPIAIVAGASDVTDDTIFAKTLDRAATELGVDIIGGFSALVHKGYTKGDHRLIQSIPQALNETSRVCSSVNIGATRSGINMDAVQEMGRVIKQLAEIDPVKCMNLVVFANAVEDNPFMAGAFHGVGEADCVINMGVSGPGVVKHALTKIKGAPFDVVSETIKKTAFKVTRMGQFVGTLAAQRLHVPFGIVDLSLAPTPARGDSVAEILEAMGLESVGAAGTTAALALLNDAVKKGGVMACEHVGGLSGAFIPVSEDSGMIQAVTNQHLNIEKLEAMTAVCSVGLDMIAVPGNTPAAVISGMIADEAAIGVINNKPTAVRVIPATGKDVGDDINFGGIFGHAPVMAVNTSSPAEFIARGGRIPAPIHSFKN